jgi:hypothetical protein
VVGLLQEDWIKTYKPATGSLSHTTSVARSEEVYIFCVYVNDAHVFFRTR